MSTEMVAVPKAELEKLEVARQELWSLIEEHELGLNFIFLSDVLARVTGPMWELAHRNWEEV